MENDNGIVKLNPYNKNNRLITEEEVYQILKTYGIEEKITDLTHYQRSFIHKSYIKKDNKDDVELEEKPDDCLDLQERSNERLEYLGDAILSATVASYLYERFPDEEEGFMTRIRTKLVNGEMLGSLADRMNLNDFLVISRHVEDKCNGRNSVKILEDIFESLIGAIYLDFNEKEMEHPRLEFYSGLGFQICQVFIINIIEKFLDFSDLILNDYNYKDQLMRYFQQKFKHTPKYKEILIEGPPNNRSFTMCVMKNDNTVIAYGKEKSKKKAEQLASKNALIEMGVIEE
jgi:dsRNA-specific ribonuclease